MKYSKSMVALAAAVFASLLVPSVAIECSGTCDVDSCDFLDNMCLNKVDQYSGSFDLAAGEPCEGRAIGLLLEMFIFLYAMLGLAIVCDDYMCVSLERMCDVWMIREDVAGATFMAFGSAAPEIIINFVSTLKQAREFPPPESALDATNMGVGAIIGSGMIAFLIIPGACALFTTDGIELLLKRRPLLRDITAYLILLVMLYIFLQDSVISLWESASLVLAYVIYVAIVILSPKIRRTYRHRYLKRTLKQRISFVNKKNKDSKKELEIDDSDITHNLLEPSTIPSESNGDYAILSGDDVEVGEKSKSVISPLMTSNMPSSTIHPKLKQHTSVTFAEEEDKETNNFNKDENDVPPVSDHHGMKVGTSVINPSEEEDSTASNAILSTKVAEQSVHDDVATTPVNSSQFVKFIKMISKPLIFMFDSTCPNCEEGSWQENQYPITFIMSFIWVSFFSTIIGSCVSRWTSFTPAWAKGGFFGLLTIAIGAEIPDTIQSVTMAKRGYGSMAVSNALGSQIINIALGLGLSWLIANIAMPANQTLQVTDSRDLSIAAGFQFGAVTITFITLLGMALYHRENKATLTPYKGWLMIGAYILIIISYVIVMTVKNSGPGPCA